MRLRLDRIEGDALAYEGQISTPAQDFPARVTVDAAGDVTVDTTAGGDLAEKARLIVRTVLRHATSEGQPPPRRIQRWRGDK